MAVTSRKTETPVYDGSTGAQVDTHVNYELGDEIDGVFVPFVTVRGAFVDHTIRLAKDKAAKEQAAQPSGGETGAPQAEQVPTEPQETTGETSETQ